MSATTARRLREAGQRVTGRRLAVAAALSASRHQVTAQELWERMRPRHAGLGRATVFRTLEALTEAGLARRLERDGHVYAYVACRPAHHHHLACRVCGTVEEVGEELVAEISRRARRELGFEIEDARLDFYGVCRQCAADAAAAEAAEAAVPA
ncbi:MAG: Fur family transcriptional regulator [Candidatus Limnocylindria bacterium]